MLGRSFSKRVIGSAAAAAGVVAMGVALLAQPAATESDGKAAKQPAPRGASQTAPPPSADEVLGKMLKPRRQGQEQDLNINEPPAIDRTSGDAAMKPHAPVVTVMREGTPLVNRVGRLTQVAGPEGSRAEFTFEVDGQALRDPPLIILPNLRLMAMEDAVRAASRDLRFRVSGVVTEYRGRNYLLLEKVTVVQDASQQFKPN
jgi:hypothetical protein